MRRDVTIGIALILAACSCSSSTEPAPPPPPPSATRPDELAPGELAEGPSSAFGLPLPAVLRVDRVEPNFIRARGHVKLEQVTTYVRSRVEATNIAVGPAKTIFDDAKVKAPRKAAPTLDGGPTMTPIVRFEVSSTHGVTTLVARQELRPKVPEGLSEDQRWERAGIRKDGKPLDPKKFE